MKVKKWIESLQIPEGFPVITMGWPDEAHGITPSAWMDYCDELAEEAAEEGFEYAPQSWEAWRDEQREQVSEGIEFSHHNCDLCGSLPGRRDYATAWNKELTDYVQLEICEDCVMFFANGDVPDHLEEDDN